MKKTALLFVALLQILTAGAQRVSVAEGPYLQAVSQEGFTVVWTTDIDAVAWVEIAPDDGTHFYACERPRHYDTVFGRRNTGRLHKVRIEGLAPATTYRYRIMNRGIVSDDGRHVRYTEGRGSDVYKGQPFRVTTLDPGKESVTFAVVNDMHEHDGDLQVLFADARERRYDFVCFNGDMTSSIPDEESIFKHYMSSASRLFAAETPLYVVRGNHENRGRFATHFHDYFPSTNDHGEPYYAFRHGPVFFIVLDCGEDKPDNDIEYSDLIRHDDYRNMEAEWLKSTLASEECRKAPVKIVFCHIPPDAKGWHGAVEVQEKFVPLLNDAEIDLMISGHLHRYRFYDKGTQGRKFPVVVNPARSRLEVSATADSIEMTVFDTEKRSLHTYKINK